MKFIDLNPGGVIGAIVFGGLAMTFYPTRKLGVIFFGVMTVGVFAGNYAWERLFKDSA